LPCTSSGGAAGTVAAWLTRTDARSAIVSHVGDDPAGAAIVTEFDALGVSHGDLVIPGETSGVVVVLVEISDYRKAAGTRQGPRLLAPTPRRSARSTEQPAPSREHAAGSRVLGWFIGWQLLSPSQYVTYKDGYSAWPSHISGEVLCPREP
jgi:hypothetical protein